MSSADNQPDASLGFARILTDFLGKIPVSKLPSHASPEMVARQISRQAAHKAALTAGSLALPPGPIGWLTVLPELLAIWKIQAQMVSDIAATFGQHAELGREQMLWCLFRHSAAQAFRGIVVHSGNRLLFRSLTQGALQHLIRRIGVRLTQRSVGHGLARWLPLLGAAGVAGFALRDTRKVAATAIELFSGRFGQLETPASATAPPAAGHHR
ncbi:hypothetical protein ACYJW8_11460 [Frateuria aurantia]